MLSIKKQSTNNISIVGVLKSLEIEEKISAEGKAYVMGSAIINVDQEVEGKMVENQIPIRMFSMKLKKDGSSNSNYNSIVKMKDELTPANAVEDISMASTVSITNARLSENMYLDKKTGSLRTGFQIGSNFINKATSDEQQFATFELSGVIGSIASELDKDGQETGRLNVKLIVVGYSADNSPTGKVDIINLIAENPVAVNHIQTNYEKGDTVNLAGIVNMTYKKITWEEQQGFGQPIKRERTESARELIITSGSQSGLDEALSYDSGDIKMALDERQSRINALSEKKPAAAPKKPSFDVGF